MAEYVERFGRRMKECRDELDMTQTQLARKLNGNVDAAQVSRWERGVHDPESNRKEDIARALETTVADLVAGPLSERQEKGDTPDLMSMNGDEPGRDLDPVFDRFDQLDVQYARVETHLKALDDRLLAIVADLEALRSDVRSAGPREAKAN